MLADYARRNADRLTRLDVGDQLLAELRILNGRDVDLAQDANRVSNRLRDALTSISPTLERVVGERLGQAGIRDLLKRYPTPTLLRRAGQARIWKAFDAHTATLPAETRWGQIISDPASDLERIHTQRKALETEIEEVFSKHPLGKVLASLCGFGTRTGARTLAEIGNPHRLADGGRPAAYAGLTPVDRQSGTSIRSASKNRSGNHRLKDAMFIAAFAASRHDPWAKAYHQKKRTEGKNHTAAMICLTRRRCDLILDMHKTGTPYNPTRLQAA